jgi:hypothetical protein
MAEFTIMRAGKLLTYTNYADIPADFDHVIKFVPDIPAGPHTEDEHEQINAWNDRLQQLMEIERARSRQSR